MDGKKGVMLILITALISGFSIFINKYSVSVMDSSVFTFLKNVVVAVFLLSVLLFTNELSTIKTLSKKQWQKLVTIGFVGGSVPFLLFFKGLSLSSAANGAFLHKTMFIYASIFALLFLKEKLSPKIFVAALMLLSGNFLLLKMDLFTFGVGEILVLTATLFWAAENVISKHALKDMSGNVVAFGRMFFGSLFILGYLVISGKTGVLMTLSLNNVIWTLITSLLLMLYVMTYYNGLKFVNVSTATSILLLGSPVTMLLSYAFSDGALAALQVLGIILVSIGVVIAITTQFSVRHTHSG